MRRRVLKIFIGTLFVIGIVAAHADAVRAQEKRRSISENGRYAFDVMTQSRESNVCNSEDEAKKRPDTGVADEIIYRHCLGVFYIAQNGSYYPQLAFPLVDESLPGSALVSDSGQYVVTFGYGPSAVVIYRTDGTLIKQLGLRDVLTEDDISAFDDDGNSVGWGEGHYFDEENGLLVLKISVTVESVYELKLDLSTGDLTEPKRSFLVWSGADDELPGVDRGKWVEPEQPCVAPETKADAKRIVYLASGELVNRATARFTQKYPPIARIAHATGTVVVEVLVDEKGSVRCASAISGHPLLQAAAKEAALKWKFAPLEAFGRPAQMVGTIAFHFGRVRPAGQ